MYSRQTADLVTTRGSRGLPTILTAIVILLIAALAAGAIAVVASRGATTHPASGAAPFVPVSIQADGAGEHLGAKLAAPAFVPVTIQPDRGSVPATVQPTTRSPHSAMLGKRPRHGGDGLVSGPTSYSEGARRAVVQQHLNGAGN